LTRASIASLSSRSIITTIDYAAKDKYFVLSSQQIIFTDIAGAMDRSKIVAIVSGVISILLAIVYLLVVQLIDFRGEMLPAPIVDTIVWKLHL
jgi:hypothetical protein